MHPKAATVGAVVVAAMVGALLALAVRVAERPRRYCPVRLAMALLATERALAVGLPVRVAAILDLAALPALVGPRARPRPQGVSRGS